MMDNTTKPEYLLGVDGGNSKTDYLLCRTNGEFVDILRCPTCSHERFGNYDGMESAMRAHLDILFQRNNITVQNIAAATFGLAGADLPSQIEALNQRVSAIGFKRFALANDGILGVKAMAESGVCAINGTGTVIVGIDENGQVLQVGGIGIMSGDTAGGAFIMREGIKAVYSYFYRLGKPTLLAPKLLNMLGIETPAGLFDAISDSQLLARITKDVISAIDTAALDGDDVAKEILDNVGKSIGEGVCGCIRNLDFSKEITIVMAGSIWNIIKYPGMVDNFKTIVADHAAKGCQFVHLESPPALGALFWAKEIHGDKADDGYRKKMLKFLTLDKYAELAKEVVSCQSI